MNTLAKALVLLAGIAERLGFTRLSLFETEDKYVCTDNNALFEMYLSKLDTIIEDNVKVRTVPNINTESAYEKDEEYCIIGLDITRARDTNQINRRVNTLNQETPIEVELDLILNDVLTGRFDLSRFYSINIRLDNIVCQGFIEHNEDIYWQLEPDKVEDGMYIYRQGRLEIAIHRR